MSTTTKADNWHRLFLLGVSIAGELSVVSLPTDDVAVTSNAGEEATIFRRPWFCDSDIAVDWSVDIVLIDCDNISLDWWSPSVVSFTHNSVFACWSATNKLTLPSCINRKQVFFGKKINPLCQIMRKEASLEIFSNVDKKKLRSKLFFCFFFTKYRYLVKRWKFSIFRTKTYFLITCTAL